MNMPGAGVRRKRNRMPTLAGSGDSTTIKYNSLSTTLNSISALGNYAYSRYYCPGNARDIIQPAGPGIVSFYSTGKFLPGTTIKWEPNVSFSTSGRVFAGFTDNPEVITVMAVALDQYYATPNATTYAAYADLVKGLGSTISFPVWQETSLNFPTKLRRKMFDINKTATFIDTNVVDRSVQVAMFTCVEGVGTGSSVNLGGFWFHDNVAVEGVTSVIT